LAFEWRFRSLEITITKIELVKSNNNSNEGGDNYADRGEVLSSLAG